MGKSHSGILVVSSVLLDAFLSNAIFNRNLCRRGVSRSAIKSLSAIRD